MILKIDIIQDMINITHHMQYHVNNKKIQFVSQPKDIRIDQYPETYLLNNKFCFVIFLP